MGSERFDIALVTGDASLDAMARARLSAAGLDVADARRAQDPAATRAVLAVYSAAPPASALQPLLDLAAGLDAPVVCALPRVDVDDVRALLSAGAHDVIAHDDLEPARLRAALAASAFRAARAASERRERDADRALLRVLGRDLRNPLHTIRMGAQMLRRAVDDPRAQIVDGVDRSARAALRLTDDALTFTRARAEGLDLAVSRDDVFRLVARCADDARVRGGGRREVTVEVPLADGEADVDAPRIEQAVGNLLTNALMRSPVGSRVVVRGASDAAAVYVDVEARGDAGEAARVAALLAPDVPLAVVLAQGSLGVGLFNVARIVEAHGGRVEAAPGRPDGVRFRVELPRAQPRERLDDQCSGALTRSSGGSTGQPKIRYARMRELLARPVLPRM